jgi:signal transduction histidine kinase
MIAMASRYVVRSLAVEPAQVLPQTRSYTMKTPQFGGAPDVPEADQTAQCNGCNPFIAAMFDQISEAVVIIDPATHKLCYMNAFALRAQGWSKAALGKKTLAETGYGSDREMIATLFDSVLTEGKGSFSLQSVVTGRTCNAQGYAITAAGGAPRVLLIVRDISEQTDAERARKELLSVITHELRTPLTSIKGALELLKGGATGALSDQANSLVTIAAANSERMLGLIRDILEMEEINQAGFQICPEPLDLSALVQATLEAHSGYGAHLAVTFADAGTEADLMVMSDPRRVSQVLSNLLSNAAKVTDSGGTVELWACREGAEAAIYVRDHGPGIPEDLRDKLFERFAKSPVPNRSQVSGSGLGLSIVKTLVIKLGGTISFSTVTDMGTTFRVALPLAEA